MSSAEACCYDYGIDASDMLVFLNDDWLDFARSNGAPELRRERVLGHELWEFVADAATRDFYRSIFADVRRRRQPVTVPFRGDSPDYFRFMHLVISPGQNGEIEFCSQLIREQKRPYLPLLDRTIEHAPERPTICSICLRIPGPDAKWVEPEQAVARLELFDTPKPPTLDYHLCPACTPKRRGLPGRG